jgi:hypothetical protein
MKTWVYGDGYRFAQVWEYTFGPRFAWLPNFLVLFAYLSFCAFGAWEMHHYLLDFLLYAWPSCPSILLDKWLMTYVISAVFVVPVLFLPRLSSFVAIGWINLFASLTGFICIILSLADQIQANGFDPQKQVKLLTSEPRSILHCISKLNSAVFFHPTAAIILQDMERPNMRRCVSLTWIASITSGLFDMICGVASYFLFQQANDYDLIFHFLDRNRPETTIGIFAIYVVSVTSTGFFVWFMADNLASFTLRESEGKLLPRLTAGIVVILGYAALNFIGHVAVGIADVVGSVMVIALVYILCPVFYLAQFGFSRIWSSIGAILLLVVGVGMIGINLYYQIHIIAGTDNG